MDSSLVERLPIVYKAPLTRRVIYGIATVTGLAVGGVFIATAPDVLAMVLGALVVALMLAVFLPIVFSGPTLIADDHGIDVRKSVAGSPRGRIGWHEIRDITTVPLSALAAASALQISVKGPGETNIALVVLSEQFFPRSVEKIAAELTELKERFDKSSSPTS